jgi:hypothetical protein
LNVSKDTNANVPDANEHAEFLKQGHGKVKALLELAKSEANTSTTRTIEHLKTSKSVRKSGSVTKT